jgi:hypothetical protein
MTKRTTVILPVLIVLLFLVLNLPAYRGYFQDDDINNMQWTRWGSIMPYLQAAATPIYSNSFRAIGFLYYRACERLFGLRFAGYIAVLQAIHIFNIWILWLVIRRLGVQAWAACAGCGFFALHMALFDAVWRPAYVFDVLCAALCLVSLLFWMRGNWILSFVSFWLAYKAKELAVMLPFVLLLYEVWFGGRRWLRLAPFVAVSLSFGLQALFWKPESAGAYAYDFTMETLANTVPFYVERIFLVPYLGFLLLLSPVVIRSRKALFGLAVLALFFIPLIFLPGRVFDAYCYLPFTGLAMVWAGVSETAGPMPVALFFLLWAPLDLQWLQTRSGEALRQGAEARTWMNGVGGFIRGKPPVNAFVYEGMPEGFRPFGVEAAVKYFTYRLNVDVPRADSPQGIEVLQTRRAAVLEWDPEKRRLTIESP